MFRFLTSLVAAIAVLGALFGASRIATAQDSDAAAPLVAGSWIVSMSPGDAEYSIRQLNLSADGTAIAVSGSQTVGLGVWESTGEGKATVTIVFVTDGPAYIEVRSSIEVSADGNAFTGTFTDEIVVNPDDDSTSREIGPGTIEGKRQTATAPGTPDDSFENFFPQPEATPQS